MTDFDLKHVKKAHVISRQGTEHKINHYQVDPEREIKGKPSLIFARDTKREGKPVVLIKRFNKNMKNNDYVLREMERNELDLAIRLEHDNIVRTIEIIDDRQWANVFMVMEFMGGGRIMDYDHKKKCYKSPDGKSHLSNERIAEIMRDALAGLCYMHQQNIVHRDIKPANILLTEGGTAKIADFGVSTTVEVDEEGCGILEASKDAALIGTLWFLPLESYNQSSYDGFSGDVYALGVTLFAMMCGKLPLAITNQTEFFNSLKNRDTFKYPSKIRGGSMFGIRTSSPSPYFETLQAMLEIHHPEKRPKAQELIANKIFS